MDFAPYTTKTVAAVFAELATGEAGLTDAQVADRRQQYGPNQLHSLRVGWWQILRRQLRSPFVYLLFGAALLALLLGRKVDGGMILLFVGINTGLGFFQEYRSEQTLKLLKKYLVSCYRVRRGGQDRSVVTADLVPGDRLFLEPGGILPADLRLVEAANLMVDESALTGESAAVAKAITPLSQPTSQINEAQNIGFSGTTVVGGQGSGIVIATGRQTNYGQIARLTTETTKVSSFEKQISRFSKFTIILVTLTLLFVVVASVILKESPSLGELAVFSIALAVSVIPEALPVVITFSLSLGAFKLAKNHVVVKRLSALEDLGGIEVLCSDKTGTLTQNKLTLDEIYAADQPKTLLYASLASSNTGSGRNQSNNAFEQAIRAGLTVGQQREAKKYQYVAEIPFDPLRKRTCALVQNGGSLELIVRGAPEDILSACQPLAAAKRKAAAAWVRQKGQAGIRTLAVAVKTFNQSPGSDLCCQEKNLRLLGLVSFVDPLKPSSKAAVLQAKQLGVRVKILTGDSLEVAGSVAYQIGLVDSPGKVVTGAELDRMSVARQHQVVEELDVFARVSPAQKYRILQLLQEKHEVGFLGEGINDAPALKIANVALVVQGAADIAKEAADILLLKKSLRVIVDGIKEGRQVFANTSKYITATLTSNFGNFFAVSFTSLVIDFLPMLPLQILLLNLLSDFPMIAVATDKVDQSALKSPNRYDLKSFALVALLLGVVSTIFDFVYFGIFVRRSPAILQTSWFIGSVLTELLLLFSIRTKGFFLKASRPSRILLALTGVAFLFTVLVPYTSLGDFLFHFTPPQVGSLLLILGIAGVYFVLTEMIKLAYYHFFDPGK